MGLSGWIEKSVNRFAWTGAGSCAAPAQVRIVVLDFSSVPVIDITAGMILRGLVRTLKDRGIRVEIAELRDEVVVERIALFRPV